MKPVDQTAQGSEMAAQHRVKSMPKSREIRNKMVQRQPKYLFVYAATFLAACGYGVSLPLLAILLDGMGADPVDIGINAAMPALGWLIASLLLPALHRVFS